MNKDDHKQNVAMGNEGQKVLSNVAYKHAIAMRKGHLMNVFCNTKAEQSDIREEAWRTMQNLTALESYFQQMLTTGTQSDEMLNELQIIEDENNVNR